MVFVIAANALFVYCDIQAQKMSAGNSDDTSNTP